MKLLYAENHERFAETVVAQFLPEHSVTVCPTVSEAVARLSTDSWDAVLIDYDLDDGKGDVIAWFASGLRPRPRLIACSSHERGNQAILTAGADAICGKMEFHRINEVLSRPSSPSGPTSAESPGRG